MNFPKQKLYGLSAAGAGTIIMDDLVQEDKVKNFYWVAVIYRTGKKTEAVQYPAVVFAKSEDAAKKQAIKEIPAKYKDRFDRLEVVVRPF